MAAKRNYSVTPFIFRSPVQMARLLLTPLPADTFRQSRDQLNIYVPDDNQEGKDNINDILNSQGYLESSNRWAAFERLIFPVVVMEKFLGFCIMINSHKHLKATERKTDDTFQNSTDEDTPEGLLRRIWIPRVATTEQIEAADPPETGLEDWINFTPEYKKQVSILAKQSARIEKVLSGRTGHVPLYVTLAVKPIFSDHIKAGDYIFLRNKMLKMLHNGKGLVSETEYAWVTRNDRMRGYNTHLFLSDARKLHFIRAQWMKLTDGQGICCEMDVIDLQNKKAVEWIGYAFRYLAPIFRQKDDSLKGVRCFGHNTAV